MGSLSLIARRLRQHAAAAAKDMSAAIDGNTAREHLSRASHNPGGHARPMK